MNALRPAAVVRVVEEYWELSESASMHQPNGIDTSDAVEAFSTVQARPHGLREKDHPYTQSLD